jgi:NTE family protein
MVSGARVAYQHGERMETTQRPDATTVAKRTGIALALSGGGFRATLFHLGALRRMNELGVLTSLDSITSVSGGSVMAACLAKSMMAAGPGAPIDFAAMATTVYDLTSCDLLRRILFDRLKPTHWRDSLAELVAMELARRVTDKSLADLPAKPDFLFCATDMAFGVNWIYGRDIAGDFQAGYRRSGLNRIPIAYATAASACFPPVFRPIDPLVSANEFQGGDATGPVADACRARIRLSDGGVYDNMALEPVWKRVATLLVSDAGGPFEFAADRGAFGDLLRYPDIMGNQARGLRKRWLIESFASGIGPGGLPGFGGSYWGTVSYRAKYDPSDTLGYSQEIATLIANIRTDFDTFSPAERAILENHGYLMADIAIRVHVPALYGAAPPALVIPYPEWLDPAKVRVALANSSKRHL